VKVVASLSQGRTAAAQCGLFTYKSVPVIFETPCIQECSGTVKPVIGDLVLRRQFLFFTNNLKIYFQIIE